MESYRLFRRDWDRLGLVVRGMNHNKVDARLALFYTLVIGAALLGWIWYSVSG